MATPIQKVFTTSYASVNVGTSSYVQIIASSPSCSYLEIQDTSAKIVVIAIGAAGSQQDIAVCPVSGTIIIPLFISPGSTVWLKAIDNTATTGYNTLSFIG